MFFLHFRFVVVFQVGIWVQNMPRTISKDQKRFLLPRL